MSDKVSRRQDGCAALPGTVARERAWGESRLFERLQAELSREAGQPGDGRDRSSKPRPDLAVALALPGRCAPGRLRSPPAAPGPRSRASVPDALPEGWKDQLAGSHGRRRRSGPRPRWTKTRTARATTVTRPMSTCEVAALIAATSGVTKGDRRSASWHSSQFHLHGQLSDPDFTALSDVPPAPDQRLSRRLEIEAKIPEKGFLNSHCIQPQGASLQAQLSERQKLHRLVTQQGPFRTTCGLARPARPSLAQSQRHGRDAAAQ